MLTIDKFGIAHRDTDDLCNQLYLNPELNLFSVAVDDPDSFNRSVKELHLDYPHLIKYVQSTDDLETFDNKNQDNWYMPDEYKNLDIAKWLLDQCHSDAELQRVGKELLMYQDRNLLVLLQFMKFFVDTMRKHNVVWGVGRGSSVASYCLFLLGVHKINSLFYELEIEEFLK
jgi:DNA polymerase III alpha subunit